MTMRALLSFACGAVLCAAPAGVMAAPDPMSAGGLDEVRIEALSGDVRVKVDKTQHIRLSGSERDAKRKDRVLHIVRKVEDVDIVVPPTAKMKITAASGDVVVVGGARNLEINAPSGKVTIEGAVEHVVVNTGSGDTTMKVKLSESGRIEGKSGSGDFNVILSGKTPIRFKGTSGTGDVVGRKLSDKKAKATVKLTSGTGDIAITRGS